MIGAPLGPAVVVAGAGSGKTETMSARVLWLVANELVRPDQILGLTFTTKAAGELGARIRVRLAQLRAFLGAGGPAGDPALAGEPTVATYHAYAGRLVAEHALRLGVEPSVRLLYRGDDLAAGPAGRPHLRPGRPGAGQRRVHGHQLGARPGRRAGRAPGRAGRAAPLDRRAADQGHGQAPPQRLRPRRRRRAVRGGPPAAGAGRRPGRAAPAGRPLPAGQAGRAGDRLRRPDGDRGPGRRPVRRGRPGRAGPVRGRAAGRVPGHRARAADHAARPVRRAPGDRGRRPGPGHLRLARRECEQPDPVRRATSAPRPATRRRCCRCPRRSATTS